MRSSLKVVHNPGAVPGRCRLQADPLTWDECIHSVFLMRDDRGATKNGKSTEVNSLVHIGALHREGPASCGAAAPLRAATRPEAAPSRRGGWWRLNYRCWPTSGCWSFPDCRSFPDCHRYTAIGHRHLPAECCWQGPRSCPLPVRRHQEAWVMAWVGAWPVWVCSAMVSAWMRCSAARFSRMANQRPWWCSDRSGVPTGRLPTWLLVRWCSWFLVRWCSWLLRR